jgi:hypothetical protein
MMIRTSMTSINGVMFISNIGSASPLELPTLILMKLFPFQKAVPASRDG